MTSTGNCQTSKWIGRIQVQCQIGVYSTGTFPAGGGVDFVLKVPDRGRGICAWTGRVQKMIRPVGTGKGGALTTTPMSLEDARRQKIRVVGAYYSEDADGRLRYNGTPECADSAQYSAESIMALVELTYEGAGLYRHRDAEMPGKIRDLLTADKGTEPLAASSKGKRARVLKDQSGGHATRAGQAAEIEKRGDRIHGTSRSGRSRTRGKA